MGLMVSEEIIRKCLRKAFIKAVYPLVLLAVYPLLPLF